jgi:hypothetical protein
MKTSEQSSLKSSLSTFVMVSFEPKIFSSLE